MHKLKINKSESLTFKEQIHLPGILISFDIYFLQIYNPNSNSIKSTNTHTNNKQTLKINESKIKKNFIFLIYLNFWPWSKKVKKNIQKYFFLLKDEGFSLLVLLLDCWIFYLLLLLKYLCLIGFARDLLCRYFCWTYSYKNIIKLFFNLIRKNEVLYTVKNLLSNKVVKFLLIYLSQHLKFEKNFNCDNNEKKVNPISS